MHSVNFLRFHSGAGEDRDRIDKLGKVENRNTSMAEKGINIFGFNRVSKYSLNPIIDQLFGEVCSIQLTINITFKFKFQFWSFHIDHISGTWPLGNLLNLGLFDRRSCCLLSPPPLGQGQKRPAGEHFSMNWRL